MNINLEADFHAETFYRALRQRGLDPCATERGVSFKVGLNAEDA